MGRAGFVAVVCGFFAVAAVGVPWAGAQSRDGEAQDWRPAVSERLVQLPVRYLDQAIEDDFGESALASAIASVENALNDSHSAILELQEALPLADGDVADNLRRALVVEKKAFVDYRLRHHALYRRALEARRDLLEGLLVERQQGGRNAPVVVQNLVEIQHGARRRFAGVEDAAPSDPEASYGRYAQNYAANEDAIGALAAAIADHPLAAPEDDAGGGDADADAVRGLLADTESRLSLLDQEVRLTGLMARLVALDAQALAATFDRVSGRDRRTGPDLATPAAVSLFTNRKSR